jgi:hypothetical protein
MRFELLAPHALKLHGIDQLVPADTVVDTKDLPPPFVPSPAMIPLDDQARELLAATLETLRQRAGNDPNIPGFGHVSEIERRAR